MLSFEEATELLQLCQISVDIQNKILILFLGYGTPSANIIKSQMKCTDTSFNGSLVERIILENDTNTLWRLKVFLNGGITSNSLCIKNLKAIYEMQIAYLTNGSCDWEKFERISDLLGVIKTNSDYDLFVMFYNLDKEKYSYLGTPTANIIHNAIKDKILYEVNSMILYEEDLDPDDK